MGKWVKNNKDNFKEYKKLKINVVIALKINHYFYIPKLNTIISTGLTNLYYTFSLYYTYFFVIVNIT